MAVYRHLVVAIPKEHVTIEKQKDGKPSIIKYVLEAPYDRKKGYARPKRTTIGYQCIGSTTTMHPTSQYAEVFPALWEAASSQRIRPAVKRIGMFTACQAINDRTGIKDILDNVYGVDLADSIMDYAVYSVIHHTNEASAFASKMRNELTYQKEPLSDSSYSRIFENKMTKELDILLRRRWALQCREDGVEKVWLCIDGSNDNCESTGVELAEKGHAKSGKNINIVSFTYAVTSSGKPVTYEVYRGGLVDAKAMRSVIDFLKECGIGINGVILDRGYCDAAAMKYLAEKKIPYVIMVKGTPDGFKQIVEEYGKKIRMDARYLIPHTYLFGCQQKVQVFKKYAHEDWLTLFFDYRNGSDRITTLLKNLYEEMSRLEKGIMKGEVPEIDSKYKKLLSISEKKQGEDTVKEVLLNTSELQPTIDEKGLYGILSSEEMTPREIHELYVSRSSSETQYRQIKTQLGYGSVRVQYTPGVRARFAAGFIASILRYEIEQASKGLGRNTNQMIQELEMMEAQKINGVYTCSHIENGRVKTFFMNLHANAEDLIDESVKFENDRLAGRIPTPRHRKTGPKKGTHHKRYDAQGEIVPLKSGVKPGTKRSEFNKDGSPRKKPGVKPGTKRGDYNKDGSLRKKPGPKSKAGTDQVTNNE